MLKRLVRLFLLAAAALVRATSALAAGGQHTFEGRAAAERHEVAGHEPAHEAGCFAPAAEQWGELFTLLGGLSP